MWLPDEGDDASENSIVCVALECAGEFHDNPTEIDDTCINEYFDRLDKLPLANLLREKGLLGAGLTDRGRTSVRDDKSEFFKWSEIRQAISTLIRLSQREEHQPPNLRDASYGDIR